MSPAAAMRSAAAFSPVGASGPAILSMPAGVRRPRPRWPSRRSVCPPQPICARRHDWRHGHRCTDASMQTTTHRRDGRIGAAGGYGWFVLPALLLSAGVVVIPALLTFLAAFTDWDGVSRPDWIGLDNFRELFADVIFWQ